MEYTESTTYLEPFPQHLIPFPVPDTIVSIPILKNIWAQICLFCDFIVINTKCIVCCCCRNFQTDSR